MVIETDYFSSVPNFR